MSDAYSKAGVSIDAGNETVERIKAHVKSTHTEDVLASVGAFGGMFALKNLPNSPTLIASTDGVGTKVKLASDLGRLEGLGQDIVNHCLNDVACAGEDIRPLFFLDYIASSELEPANVESIIKGISTACKAANCAILGGETAEMPGVYADNACDIVGTIVAIMDKDKAFPKQSMKAGDKLIGLASSGAHTNGYSLIRKLVEGHDLQQNFVGNQTLADVLLAPHRSYLSELALLKNAGINLNGIAHITGGGITENLPRALKDGLGATVNGATVNGASWQTPALFEFLQKEGNITDDEMYRVFNMGIGMILIVSHDQADAALETLQSSECQSYFIGELNDSGLVGIE